MYDKILGYVKLGRCLFGGLKCISNAQGVEELKMFDTFYKNGWRK